MICVVQHIANMSLCRASLCCVYRASAIDIQLQVWHSSMVPRHWLAAVDRLVLQGQLSAHLFSGIQLKLLSRVRDILNIAVRWIRPSVPCLTPRSTRKCEWAADLARGHEWTQQFWRKFKLILNCLIMSEFRLDQNAKFWARKLKKSDPRRWPKILGQSLKPKEICCREGPQSH